MGATTAFLSASHDGEQWRRGAAYDDVWNLHPILDNSDRKRLSRSCNDTLRETRMMRDWPGWPEHAVATADNGTGMASIVPNDCQLRRDWNLSSFTPAV
jgi:hypothetical protein